jgi:hypothetical protein
MPTLNVNLQIHLVIENPHPEPPTDTLPPTAAACVPVTNDAADPDLLALIYSRSIQDPDTGCRRWTGAHSSRGSYGTIWRNGTCEYVHRAAYKAFHGEVPEGSLGHESDSIEVHHVCGVRDCVEPSHLELVTRRQHNREHKAMREADQFMLVA